MDSGFLHRYFLAQGERRLHKWMHYFDIYERHLRRFVGKAPRVLEIGVHGGGSLAMWRAFFGPESAIVGLDIDPACARFAGDGIAVVIGSQDDRSVLRALVADHGPFDVVIDDGSHINAHMIRSFETLYDTLDAHGLYLVEDVHTSYLPKYGGALGGDSFIEFVKGKIDELHASRSRGAVAMTSFSASTDQIAIYDGITIFERRPQARRQAPVTGPMRESGAAPAGSESASDENPA